MKRIIALMVVASVLLTGTPLYAAKDGVKGASEQAQQNAGPQAIFNRVTDWFATIGKTEEAKKAILAERKARRAAERAMRDANKAKMTADAAKEEAKRAADARRKALKAEDVKKEAQRAAEMRQKALKEKANQAGTAE